MSGDVARLEMWAREQESGEGEGIYTYAVYDIVSDRMFWYERREEAEGHMHTGQPPGPPTTSGGRS